MFPCPWDESFNEYHGRTEQNAIYSYKVGKYETKSKASCFLKLRLRGPECAKNLANQTQSNSG
jgi:hypothetical protein